MHILTGLTNLQINVQQSRKNVLSHLPQDPVESDKSRYTLS